MIRLRIDAKAARFRTMRERLVFLGVLLLLVVAKPAEACTNGSCGTWQCGAYGIFCACTACDPDASSGMLCETVMSQVCSGEELEHNICLTCGGSGGSGGGGGRDPINPFEPIDPGDEPCPVLPPPPSLPSWLC